MKSKLWLFGPDRKTVIAVHDGGSTGMAALNGIALKSTGSYYVAVADRQVASPLAPQGGASTGGYLLNLVVGSPTEMKPTPVLSSASVAFGNVLAQENHRRVVTITNTGYQPVVLHSISTGQSTDFFAPAITVPMPVVMPAKATYDINIGLCAQTAGQKSTVLNISSNDSARPVASVALSANAGPAALVSISGVTLPEGNTGTKTFAFPVTLSAAPTVDVTVGYRVLDGSAKLADKDYDKPTHLSVTIPKGQTKGTIVISVRGDKKREPDEDFTVKLTSATNATLTAGKKVGRGTILNDD